MLHVIVEQEYKDVNWLLCTTTIIPTLTSSSKHSTLYLAMSFFRKKEKNLIPPVASEQTIGRAPSPAAGGSSGNRLVKPSSTATYVASRDGGYDAPSYRSAPSYNPSAQSSTTTFVPPPAPVPSYSRSTAVGDAYSRGEGNIDQDRSELFSGYNAQSAGSNRFAAGRGLGDEPAPGEENDEDVEGIKTQTRFVKQESVNSTRNALRMARETEETARNTLLKLGDQSGTCCVHCLLPQSLLTKNRTEKLANTERHLDVAKGHSHRADDRTDELKQLNRSIFRPVITFNKDSKRRAQEQKLQQRFEDDRSERERAMMDIRDTQNRLGRAATYGRGEEEGGEEGAEGGVRGRYRTEQQQAERKAQRSRYQFEATASDDEMEDELDENLDEIHDAVKRMKALGITMGQEVDNQIGRIGRIEEKTTNLDNRVWRNTERVSSLLEYNYVLEPILISSSSSRKFSLPLSSFCLFHAPTEMFLILCSSLCSILVMTSGCVPVQHFVFVAYVRVTRDNGQVLSLWIRFSSYRLVDSTEA